MHGLTAMLKLQAHSISKVAKVFGLEAQLQSKRGGVDRCRLEWVMSP